MHEDAADKGAGDAEDGDDERVAVGDVGGAVAEGGAADGLDVGEESVVEGEAKADEGPDEHDEGCRVGELWRHEESADMREVKFFELSFHGCGGVGAECTLLVYGFEVGDGKRRGLAVPAGDFVDDFDGFGVIATAHKELRRFVEGEEEETGDEHEHGKAAHNDHEVSPLNI